MRNMSELCPHLSPLPMTKPWGKWKGKSNDPWLHRVWNRVYSRNQNYICIVDGPTGSGKSYTCLGASEMQDPNFNVRDNCVFDILQFVQLVKSGKLKQGAAIIFEEVGVAASNRNWFLPENKWLSFINQTFRTKNYIIYYNAPEADMAERNLLKLAHAKIETIDWLKQSQINRVKIFDPAKYNAKKNEWFKRRVGFRRRGKTYFAGEYRLRRASKKTISEYEKMRAEYLEKLLATAEKELVESAENSSRPAKRQLSTLDIKVLAQEIYDAGTKYMDDSHFRAEKVMEDFNIGAANTKRVKAKVKEILRDNGVYAPWADLR